MRYTILTLMAVALLLPGCSSARKERTKAAPKRVETPATKPAKPAPKKPAPEPRTAPPALASHECPKTGAADLDAKSLHRLKRVWPELQAITRCASKLSALDFRVTEGKRSRDRQRELVAKGASQTMHSLHLEGKAVDIVVVRNGRVSWDFPLYRQVSKSFKRAGKALGYPVEWGGDWHSFKDGPHFQLPRNYS